MDGPQGVGADRMKAMLEDCKAEAAIVTITLPQVEHDHEYDWENRPAMASTVNTIDMDQHPSILKLNSFGIHRIIPVNALDGSVIDPMLCTFEEESLTLPSTLQDDSVLYLLYTSGSTGRPKAVVQSHSSLRSRITWGWKTFPFVQQMRRNLGANETMRRLKEDGVVCDGICGDVVMRRTPLMFVDSMTEIFGSLLAGVPLWCRIPSPNEIQAKRMWTQDIAECLELATKHEVHVSRITCLPSQFAQVLNIKKDSKSVVTCTDARADDWSSHLNLIIVSGEPCPNTLPTLFEEVMSKCRNQAALLVNLYGQTETSGDVLCLIVGYSGKHSFGRCPEAEKYIWKKRKSTFQEDRSYQHNSKDISLDAISDIERMKKSMVPCGLPIDGHSFHFAKMDTSLAGNSIDLVTFDEEEGIGRLYVEGPGVALGYLNRTHEMNHNFCQHETNCKGSLGFIFNTQDVAFRDKETGFFFIVGRAPSVDSCGQLINALTMGKVNGKTRTICTS
jgi:acyl-CoA synthetase (AMP-forming)/AMP-acid ligase II